MFIWYKLYNIYRVMLYNHCTLMYCITVLYFIVLYYTSPYCIFVLMLSSFVLDFVYYFWSLITESVVFYCIVSYCIILCFIVLFYIVLLLCVKCYCVCTLLRSLGLVYFSIELFCILLNYYMLYNAIFFCYIVLDCTVYYFILFLVLLNIVLFNLFVCLFAYTSCNIFTLSIYRVVTISIVTTNICKPLVLLLYWLWFFR